MFHKDMLRETAPTNGNGNIISWNPEVLPNVVQLQRITLYLFGNRTFTTNKSIDQSKIAC